LFEQHVRDAMVVRRAVTLGLPVNMVNASADSGGESTVVDDYRQVAMELIRHGDSIND
jgi:chromosome partitioning protein